MWLAIRRECELPVLQQQAFSTAAAAAAVDKRSANTLINSSVHCAACACRNSCGAAELLLKLNFAARSRYRLDKDKVIGLCS
jgi:hypothetical protein